MLGLVSNRYLGGMIYPDGEHYPSAAPQYLMNSGFTTPRWQYYSGIRTFSPLDKLYLQFILP